MILPSLLPPAGEQKEGVIVRGVPVDDNGAGLLVVPRCYEQNHPCCGYHSEVVCIAGVEYEACVWM